MRYSPSTATKIIMVTSLLLHALQNAVCRPVLSFHISTTSRVMIGRTTSTVFPCRRFFAAASNKTIKNRRSSALHQSTLDDQGRRVRGRRNNNNDDDDDDDDDWDITAKEDKWENVIPNNDDGWDDFDPLTPPSQRQQFTSKRSTRRDDYRSSAARGRDNNNNNNYDRPSFSSPRGGRGRDDRSSPPRGGTGRGRGRENNNNRRASSSSNSAGKINLKDFEACGLVHLYGLSSVLNALIANQRDFVTSFELTRDDSETETETEPRKPEAQLRPGLFVQEKVGRNTRSGDKARQAEQVLQLAEQLNIPITTVDKGVLNTLSGNRPHQGYVLRCGAYQWESISTIDPASNQLWLVLDEVVDPQNLGALIRTAYFFGNVQVLVCAKNSAPPSPVVSAASAGALELLIASSNDDGQNQPLIYSTNNLPRILNAAAADGFRIVGASAAEPNDDDGIAVYDLHNLPNQNQQQPTLLVLGSEGHGLRPLVAQACTEFVRIPGIRTSPDNNDNNSFVGGVDSLNVSVTGGILLWHLVQQQFVNQNK